MFASWPPMGRSWRVITVGVPGVVCGLAEARVDVNHLGARDAQQGALEWCSPAIPSYRGRRPTRWSSCPKLGYRCQTARRKLPRRISFSNHGSANVLSL